AEAVLVVSRHVAECGDGFLRDQKSSARRAFDEVCALAAGIAAGRRLQAATERTSEHFSASRLRSIRRLPISTCAPGASGCQEFRASVAQFVAPDLSAS